MVQRVLRVPEDLWERAKVRASGRDETVSEAVRKFLERYAMTQSQSIRTTTVIETWVDGAWKPVERIRKVETEGGEGLEHVVFDDEATTHTFWAGDGGECGKCGQPWSAKVHP